MFSYTVPIKEIYWDKDSTVCNLGLVSSTANAPPPPNYWGYS